MILTAQLSLYLTELWTCDSRLKSRFGDSRLESQLLYDSNSTQDSDVMARDLTRDSMRMTHQVCMILKFIVVLISAADHRHVEIWK